MYHNTLKLTGNELLEAQEKTEKQDNTVLDYCRKMGVFSPSAIWIKKNNITDKTTYSELKKKEKLTSIRRAINTLFKTGKITRLTNEEGLEMKVKTDFGSKEYLYQVV